ncbi:DUF4163 domain-containing protein [Bacillaceae bacterium SIJ1]|uniref:PdaC/SigV domain-containing protein n=1 Tax=Litoribacterium kuwaitense TaxID=1398745 RepID=UPI0013EA7CC2|nr:DUF4163 domain-containing protein [Litoribacterium kuwaitense]NGP45413.1 DUF4163 domain-containing protein [Litoribacterium kuwaitense]
MKRKMILAGAFSLATFIGAVLPGTYAMNTVVAAEQAVKTEGHVTISSINEKAPEYNVQINYPQFQGLKDQAFQESINQSIKDWVNQKKTEIVDGALEYPSPQGAAYQLFMDVTERQSGNFISAVMTTYQYTGGANGNETVSSYNVLNKAEGKSFTLPEVVKDIDQLNNLIQKEFQKHEDVYGATALNYPGVREDQPFALTDDALIVYFSEYEVAPGSVGANSVSIPRDEIALIDELADQKSNINASEKATVTVPVKKSDQGKTLISVRELAEALDMNITWNQELRRVYLEEAGASYEIVPSVPIYQVNGISMRDIEQPVFIDGHVFVHTDFLTDALDAKVSSSTADHISITR